MESSRVFLLIFAMAVVGPISALAQQVEDQGDRAVLQKVTPIYPELARHNGMAGSVKLKVLVAPDGRPKEVDIIGGNPVFIEAASSSVKKWKWTSAPHETTQVVEIKFQGSN